jgi:dTMP kinase
LISRICCTPRARQQERALQPDRLERESERFFEAVAAAYDELASTEPLRIRTLDASQPADQVLDAALVALEDLLPAATSPSGRL